MQYSVHFTNKSGRAGFVCLFYQSPGGAYFLHPVAWLVNQSTHGASCAFNWNPDPCFVWGNMGDINPGASFTAAQVVGANLGNANLIRLINNGGRYEFIGLSAQGQPPGTLTIQQDFTVQPNQVAVGIGMSGSPTFIMPARPAMNYVVLPNGVLHIAFGNFATGMVLDPSTIKHVTPLEFPAGATSLQVMLDGNNSWHVSKG